LEIHKIFQALAQDDPNDPPIKNRKLNIWGRSLSVPESTSKVAKFRFHELCGQPLSAADYLEVTNTFGTVFVLDVPKMGLHSKDMVSAALWRSSAADSVVKGTPVHHFY
jgi:protein AFG1